jgi:hypothetical protein
MNGRLRRKERRRVQLDNLQIKSSVFGQINQMM